MLKNISVRTFIMYFLVTAFLLIDGLIALLSRSTTLFVSVTVVNLIALFLLWAYMTKYLVTPINTVKKVLKK